MVTEASLQDVVGSIGNGSVNYTWSCPDGSLRSQIDFIFTSRAVRKVSYSMVPCLFSDHRAIRFRGTLGHGFPPGPGSWKLNCALLEQREVMEELRDAYLVWRNDKCLFNCISDWWEYVKVEFRCFFQAKGRKQACAKKWDFRKLQRELRSRQDLLQCGWDVREELEETKKSLKRHFEEESKRIVFRSKVEDLEKELFAETIRQNGEIRGITAPGPDRYEVKCPLYMDDVTVFCADQRSVTALIQTCEDFGRASGAKVNCGKSEAMLFREWHLEAWRLMNCFKDAVWLARNRLVINRENMSVRDCRRFIKSLLRDYSILDSPAVDEEEEE
ncbi:uncharacterized protein LOC130284987 isoform X1 [Hyla sarda]|uniref:uncharacterized protein LOC130284987 isoform X1 n=1 Tax=Hyla sarda TaxID=327740 RepID=UPI0024C2FDFF|nr:uncharacterized protein LOC130284987 isoform X1 [Hyla sarda]